MDHHCQQLLDDADLGVDGYEFHAYQRNMMKSNRSLQVQQLTPSTPSKWSLRSPLFSQLTEVSETFSKTPSSSKARHQIDSKSETPLCSLKELIEANEKDNSKKAKNLEEFEHTNQPSKLRQAKLVAKSTRAKKRSFEDVSPDDRDMVLYLEPQHGITFTLSNKRHKSGEDGQNGTFTIASPFYHPIEDNHPKIPRNLSEKDDIIDDYDIEETRNYDDLNGVDNSFTFEEDVDGLLEKSQCSKDASSLDFILSPSGKIPVVRVPATMNAKLFEYQRDGIRFLYNLYISKKGGILADDMGLGKTIQAIGFIMALKGAQSAQEISFPLPSSNSKHTSPHKPFPSSDKYSSTKNNAKIIGRDAVNKLSEKEAEAAAANMNLKLFSPIATHPILIVAPASLLQHWHKEFYTWSRLKVLIAYGKEKDAVISSAKSNRLDVLLISYDSLVSSIKLLNGIKFSCVIFDEVHRIKNKSSKVCSSCLKLAIDRKYGLTGTVMQNSFEELWCICHVVGCASSTLGDLDYFKKHFIAPIKDAHVPDASPAQIEYGKISAHSLVDKLKKFMLRRTKAAVIQQLPPKEDHVVFCSLTPLQLAIYKRIIESPLYLLLRKNSQHCSCGSEKPAIKCCSKPPAALASGFTNQQNASKMWKQIALPALTRLQQLANHVSLFVPPELINQAQIMRSKSSQFRFFKNKAVEAHKCVVSLDYDDHEKGDLSPTMTGSDLTSSTTKKTPTNSACSKPLPLADLVTSTFLKMAFGEDCQKIMELLTNGDPEMELCGKLKVLSIMLPHWKEEGSKVLLFSSSTRLMDTLEYFCVKQKFDHSRIDGTTPMNIRQTLVDRFNKNKSAFVFIMSTKACGVGLNLSSANIVVIFEPHFNVTVDMQASDRAHRIGQKRKTQVYRLVSADTIEELTYRRQIYKQQIARIAQGRDEKPIFKKNEVFGSHLLYSLLDKSQLNTVDLLGRDNPSFSVERDQNALMEDSSEGDPLLSLIVSKARGQEDGDLMEFEDETVAFTSESHDATYNEVLNPPHLSTLDQIPGTHHKALSAGTLPTDGDQNSHLEAIYQSGLDEPNSELMDELLKKAGALHSHLNSELFSEAVQAAAPVTFRHSIPKNTTILSTLHNDSNMEMQSTSVHNNSRSDDSDPDDFPDLT